MKNEELLCSVIAQLILHSSFITLHFPLLSAGENQVKNMAKKMA